MAFSGDFHQIGCVMDAALYSKIGGRTNAKVNKGLTLWHGLTHSVKLLQQMRQNEEELFDTLQAYRAGFLEEHHKLFLASLSFASW